MGSNLADAAMIDHRHRRRPVDLPVLSPDEARIVHEFRVALEQVQDVELERMRNVLYGYELLRDGMADLIAELRRENAAAVAQKPLTK
jgi:hypothetical protein